MQEQKMNSIDNLIPQIAKKLNRSQDQIVPFIRILKDNWYDTTDSIKNLNNQDYEKMKIPHRVSSIIQQITKQQSQQQIKQEISKQKIKGEIPEQKHSKITLNQVQLANMCNTLVMYLSDASNGLHEQKRQILQTLKRLIQNISSDPYEVKYRKLKKGNKLIEKTIVKNKIVQKFILKIGFQDEGQFYHLHVFQVPHFVFLEDFLANIIQNLQSNSQNKIKTSNNQQSPFIDFSKIPTNFPQNNIAKQGQLNQHFSQQKLSEMNYNDALNQLMRMREQMMSQPPKNRKLKIYHKRFENKNVVLQQITFQQQFSKSQDQKVAKYWKQLISQNRKGQSFQSKRKIQFQQLIKQKVHKETLIRIKLPNQLIIQALFGPLQTLKNVFNFVAEIVIGDLYIFTTPPVKKMGKKQLNQTLYDLQAVPMGRFYLGSNTEWIIQQKYHSMIQK